MAPPDLGVALAVGSRPADEALEVLDRVLAETPSLWLLLNRAWLLAMLDRGEEARALAEEAYARLPEQDDSHWSAWMLAEVSSLAGDHEDESRRLRELCEWIAAAEQRAYLAYYVARLARSLWSLGRVDEAEQVAERARALEAQDPASRPEYVWRQVLARIYAYRGQPVEAERLAREAVARSGLTDSLNDQCLALWDLAEVLAAAERFEEADAALEQALERCLRKKNLALARQVRERLAELRAETQPAP
jgi:tetratricopeptide (TPR) repeat protein